MQVDGKPTRPIWPDSETGTVCVIDQRLLPHEQVIAPLKTVDDIIRAIQAMYVRGAPLIGVTAAYGVWLAALNVPAGADPKAHIQAECERIKAARPTAVNLVWAVDRVWKQLAEIPGDFAPFARQEADAIAELEADCCKRIGEHGLSLIQAISEKKGGEPVQILTHCNAGWLATIEYGTATAPMYTAHAAGIPIHVWADETRPLNQGARITAWELGKAGIPHTVITDNAGGHLMQHGRVDLVIVGTDRSTHTGDVANKIGTYLKALAARDNQVPFYVALPSSTFDWRMRDGVNEIPIETRDPDEVHYIQGLAEGKLCQVRITPAESPAANYAFDVTPARLVTGFITERGICAANEAAIRGLFPDK